MDCKLLRDTFHPSCDRIRDDVEDFREKTIHSLKEAAHLYIPLKMAKPDASKNTVL